MKRLSLASSRSGKTFLLGLMLLLTGRANLYAQQSITPHIGYVYPAGGRGGMTFQVKVGGQFLDGVTNVFISGFGIRASVLAHTKPLTPQQANALREKARELQEKRQAIMRGRRQGSSNSTNLTWTAADQKAMAEIRARLATFQRRPQNPAIAETVTVQITIPADAEPGNRELRLSTPQGLSNPLVFCIGQFPEVVKQQSLPVIERPLNQKARQAEAKAVAPTEMNIVIPAVVNGQILPGGVDRYRFHARQGQKLVIAVSARELIPYIPDAVPGWFQATLALYDAKGKELAYSDDFRFHPDPVLYFEVPRQGEYMVEIRDSVYRGREDFVYRVTISEAPFITGVFPLGATVGPESSFALKGWNLPVTNLTTYRTNGPGACPVSVSKGKLVSNLVPLSFDTLPECLEQEPNDTPTNAQFVTLPVIVNGRIGKPGDRDFFSFKGRAGQEIVAEIYARRLDSPLDSVLKLTDILGRQLAFNDDHEDKGSGLNTHHADSYIRTKLPADGTYYLQVADAQHQGGPDYAYRLRVSAPRPDFELRVVPSSINVRAGLSAPITVYALRKDGFTNAITLALDDAPAGFSLSGARIPEGQDQIRLTLTAGETPRGEPVNIRLQGRARIGREFVVRDAVPAEDMMQAFAYRHLVAAQELKVAVTGRGLGRGRFQFTSPLPLKIPAGGTARLQLGGSTALFMDRFNLELAEPPEGVSIAKIETADRGAEVILEADPNKARPGTQGNLVINLLPSGKGPAAQKAKKQANQRRIVMGTLPAVPFEIVGQK